MQTPTFGTTEYTAKCLDTKRLSKLITEVYQIMRALIGETKAYANHPVTVSWRRHEGALLKYVEVMHAEYFLRTGKTHKSYDNIHILAGQNMYIFECSSHDLPLYYMHERTKIMYRSHYIRKDSHYRELWPDVPNDIKLVYVTGKVSSL